MHSHLLFNALYVASCTFALVRGGAPERIGALILVADFQLSHLLISPYATRYASIEWRVLATDAAAFLGLYLLSQLSSRFWPAWMAAMQGIVVISHLSIEEPSVIATVYGYAVALWSYALLALLAIATWRSRRRLARYGFDPAWAWQLPEDYRRGAPAHERPRAEPPRADEGPAGRTERPRDAGRGRNQPSGNAR